MWLISTGPVGGSLPFELKPGEFAIGRSADCQIFICDSSVSRAHARLTVNPAGDMHLTDLGSLNGTVVNNRRINQSQVGPWDRLQVGDVPLLLVIDREGRTNLKPPKYLAASADAPTQVRKRRQSNAELTRHQREVLQLIAQGHSEEKIAVLLGRSYHTIHNHLKAVFKHLGVHTKRNSNRHGTQIINN